MKAGVCKQRRPTHQHADVTAESLSVTSTTSSSDRCINELN
jgi:hypothetical protein